MASATISLADPATCAKPADAPVAYDIHSDVGEVLFTRQQMHERVQEMGQQLGLAFQASTVAY